MIASLLNVEMRFRRSVSQLVGLSTSGRIAVNIEAMTARRRSGRRKPLIIDTLPSSLEEQAAAFLRKGLPPDTDEFDRVCYQAFARFLAITAMVHTDWTSCPDVERSPDTLYGAWRIKGTRIPVQSILDNATAGCTPEEIVGLEIYPDISVEVVRRILAHARRL